MTSSIYQAALSYGYRGWLVLPLSGPKDPGASPGKRPLIQAWQKAASSDEEVISDWWKRWPDANVGVKFGPDSNLVDLECDDDEQEKALAALFDGEFPRTPTFTSSRGKHRLFLWNDNLPAARDKAVVYIGGVGFRTGGSAKGAQSVFPPSIHKSGDRYDWLIHPDEADVAEIPEIVIAKIANSVEGGLFNQPERTTGKPQEYWDRMMKEGLPEGYRNQGAAELIGKLLSKLDDKLDAEAIQLTWNSIAAWNAINQPPIPHKELETTFRSIVRREQEKSVRDEYQQAVVRYGEFKTAPPPPTVSEDGKTIITSPEQSAGSGASQEDAERTWKLTCVNGKPIIWQLESALWDGCVELNTDQFLSHRKIAAAVLEQKKVLLGPWFKILWNGTKKEKGMGEKLVALATTVESEPEQHRDVVVADILLTSLGRCTVKTAPEMRGHPVLLDDGSVWFKVTQFHIMLKSEYDSITFGELSSLLRLAGAENVRHRFGDVVNTFKVLRDRKSVV